MRVTTDSFDTGSAAAGNTIAVTGLGFTPKIVFFMWNGITGPADAVAGRSTQRGFGYTVGPNAGSDNYAITNQSLDAQAAAACDKRHDNAACIALISNAASPVDAGRANLASFDADGFTLNILTQFASSFRVHYLAFGGAEITNIEASQAQAPATPQTVSYTTGIGFQPDLVILISVATGTGPPAQGLDSHFVVGAATGTGAGQQGVLSVMSNDGAATMLARSYCRLGECFAGINGSGTGFEQRAVLDGFQSDGFRLNWTTSTSQNWFFYLCIKGGRYSIGSLLTKNNTTEDIVVSGLPITPKGALLLSAGMPESSAGVLSTGERVSVGCFSGTGGRTIATYDRNGTADSEVAAAIEHDAAYARINDLAAPEGSMRVTALNSRGWTSRMTVADDAQNFAWYLAAGDQPSGGTVHRSTMSIGL